MTSNLDPAALEAAHLRLNPEWLAEAQTAFRAHAADPGRKGDGLAKAILTYNTLSRAGEREPVDPNEEGRRLQNEGTEPRDPLELSPAFIAHSAAIAARAIPRPDTAEGERDQTTAYALPSGRHPLFPDQSATILALSERIRELEGALTDIPKTWELSYGEVDDYYEGSKHRWRVHNRSGNRSDREWDLIGQGDTPADALRDARITETDNG